MKRKTETVQKVQTADADLQLVLSNAIGMTESALEEAVDYCGRKMGTDDRQTVVEQLKQGDRTACGYLYYHLAGQVAEWLGAWDESIKAVYIYDSDATAEDVCFGRPETPPMLHLLIWVQRKTNALDATLGVLSRALVQSYTELLGRPGLEHLLDAQVVDDNEVNNNIGYSALLCSLHTCPIRIWER
ncbi:MAG: hypothetical protein JW900_03340 [Anaerolineae bacterium]|nr:hypothetical protein [Anaerolineae bacterium]